MTNSSGDKGEKQQESGERIGHGAQRRRWTAPPPEEVPPDADTRADNHFSCLDKGYYKYSCSHHHCYQPDIPEKMQHFLRESILTISAWASSLGRLKRKKHTSTLIFPLELTCLHLQYLSERNSTSPFLALIPLECQISCL